MNEILHDRKAAIRNTVFYAITLVVSLGLLIASRQWWHYLLAGLCVLWTVGGLKANTRAIKHGFILNDD
jgi:hypothetical protein